MKQMFSINEIIEKYILHPSSKYAENNVFVSFNLNNSDIDRLLVRTFCLGTL